MIGIVGGVGPFAGLDLLKKVYDNTIASSDQEHLDTVLISMPSTINDRTEYLQDSTLVNPAYGIIKVLKKLEQVGVTIAGIPCNTAHADAIFEVVQTELNQADSKVILLNIISETVTFIRNSYPAISRIGILSTTGIYKSEIYKQKFEAVGYEVIVPTVEIQEKYIHPAIYDNIYGIKSFSHPVKQQAVDNLYQGINFFRQQQVQAIILACTEIPLAIRQKKIAGMITIDPTNILARAMIHNYCPEKLKQDIEVV